MRYSGPLFEMYTGGQHRRQMGGIGRFRATRPYDEVSVWFLSPWRRGRNPSNATFERPADFEIRDIGERRNMRSDVQRVFPAISISTWRY
jgi:hypothetical protein